MKISVLMALLVALVLAFSDDALTGQAASVRITMTVLPQFSDLHRFVVELYDEEGRLVDRSEPALPPSRIVVHSADGRRMGIDLPAVALAAPTTIRIYLKGTVVKREIIERADVGGRSKGVSSIPGLDAVEFVTTQDLETQPSICLCFPSDLDPTVVDSLGIFRLEEPGADWVRLPDCQRDPAECTIAAQVEAFGVFRVMAKAATDLKRLVVFPNPFVPNLTLGGTLRFANLTPEATVRIYDITGQLVWTKHIKDSGGIALWHGLNDAGQSVASGIYLFVVTGPRGDEATGKITLIR
ncbi:MAG: T9SS type A sorting domain-containing protein [Candidatus Eisenbacteria bacterium]